MSFPCREIESHFQHITGYGGCWAGDILPAGCRFQDFAPSAVQRAPSRALSDQTSPRNGNGNLRGSGKSIIDARPLARRRRRHPPTIGSRRETCSMPSPSRKSRKLGAEGGRLARARRVAAQNRRRSTPQPGRLHPAALGRQCRGDLVPIVRVRRPAMPQDYRRPVIGPAFLVADFQCRCDGVRPAFNTRVAPRSTRR